MAKTQGGSDYGRVKMAAFRGGLSLILVVATAGGLAYGVWRWRGSAIQSPTAVPSHEPSDSSKDALDILAELRTRYGQVAPAAASSNTPPRNAGQALLAGVAESFEQDPFGLLPKSAATVGKADARVVVPAKAGAALQVEDLATGLKVDATLEEVSDVSAEMADGFAIYPHAHASGATVLRRVMPNGNEDYLSFAGPPANPSISYRVAFSSGVAGLRMVSNTLELLDKEGTPRLRVAPPALLDREGGWIEAKLSLDGCSADSEPSAPWQRAVTHAGTDTCRMRVSWSNDQVAYPALLDPAWTTTGSLAQGRQGHTATILSTGKVLVAGGTTGTAILASAELYDPSTGTWAATASMTGARQFHTAVQLPTSSNPTTSGKVLIAGGANGSTTLNTAQLYSATAGTWIAASDLNVGRYQQAATLLPSGKVLLTGGISGGTVLSTAAVYNPASGAGSWAATSGPMPAALKAHSATLLTTSNPQLNGKVIVAGGNTGSATVATVFLYDPAQNAFSTLANMPSSRDGHTATVLSNNKVLLAGGRNGSSTLSSAVVFDPGFGPGSWLTVGAMTTARQGHTANLLSNGKVLVAGGSNGSVALSSAELFNGTSSWAATAILPASVKGHTATVLTTGLVLLAGGTDGSTASSAARLYDATAADACTTGSQCASGFCSGGVCCNSACSDQCSSCTIPGKVGTCSPKSDGTTCNDGNACTQTDSCQSGACAGANPVVCSASDQCHAVGACDSATGICSNPAKSNGTSCNDSNGCTQTDQCLSGACIGSNPVLCSPADACHVAGTCTPSNGVCTNPSAPDGTSCSDSDACTTGDSCQTGTCQAGSPVPVDDSNPCTADSCDPVAGVQHAPLSAGTACGDGNACNGLELCNGSGVCLPGVVPGLDDGNPCTTDSCDPASGVVHVPVALGTSCSDGNACNGSETCNGSGSCLAGTAPVVDDGNPCTADSCDPASGVAHTPVALGTLCSDGNACNGSETCNGSGSCLASTAPVVDDGNPCTTDSCDPASGVAHTPVAVGTGCSDGNACNGSETCNGSGSCLAGTAPVVDDGNPCTADSCDPASGVAHAPVASGTSCSDGNACNGSETCNGSGSCLAGTAPVVDDGNPCTADSCDPESGALHAPVASGTSCSDGNACNGSETCNGSGSCLAGTAPVVDDGNPCTVDSCDPASGAVHAPVASGTSCSDGNACNGSETCNGLGSCLAGTALVVDDGNLCTADSCDAVAGVQHLAMPFGSACSDGNLCNGSETCTVAGQCVAGTPPGT